MMAAPATPAYGVLSILVQALAEVSIVRILPPSVFWPRPKVDSAVVMIRPVPARRAPMDISWFHKIVRQVFLHRRKNLRHVLAGMWQDRWTKAEVDAWLQQRGLDGQLRAEALDVVQFRSLSMALKERWGEENKPSDGLESVPESESEVEDGG
jgi:16S rRNA (adenine1518-N6/adenine1519-N6)-dimethyltransferase